MTGLVPNIGVLALNGSESTHLSASASTSKRTMLRWEAAHEDEMF